MKTGWKKRIAFWLVPVLAAAGLMGCGQAVSEQDKNQTIRIGVALYREDDTFIGNLMSNLEQKAKEYEQATGRRIILDIEGAKSSQLNQNRQVERLLELECDVLCINPVDRMAVSSMIDSAMESDIPIVFFNRQPVDEDMHRWGKLYYVGIDAKETAQLQGQIVLEHYKAAPESFDENGDGVVSYVLLEGESSHQDSLIRTEVAIQTIMNGEMPIERLTGGIGNWERSQGAALTEKWIREFPGQIELIISNNDDMALGAIDILDREDLKNIEVVGIDATVPGREAVKQGKMIGTVAGDVEKYAENIFRMAVSQALKEPMPDDITFTEDKYVWCPQYIINREDL